MQTICVYCGSNSGNSPLYREGAETLGKMIAERGLRLIYGGGNVGLMGAVANSVLSAGGKVTGIIPQHLANWEVAHQGLTELEIVDSMHARKMRMFELADAFITLPGGFGTMEEIFEMLTWRQIGINNKPCAFLDINKFYAPLIQMIDQMVEQGFLNAEQRHDLWYGENQHELFTWLEHYQPASANAWLDKKRQAAKAIV